MASHLIAPHGGKLINLVVDKRHKKELKEASQNWLSWDLSPRQMCDLELLLNGAFSPLSGFMAKSDYESICSSKRLQDGTVWPIPIVLDVPEDIVKRINSGNKLVLRDPEGLMLAVLTVEGGMETRSFSRSGNSLWHDKYRASRSGLFTSKYQFLVYRRTC